jgi:hypothetical protein
MGIRRERSEAPSVKDLYSVVLNERQIARACEEYVLRSAERFDVNAKADVRGAAGEADARIAILVRVSERRRGPRPKT